MDVKITHPETGKKHTVSIPDDHDGSRVKIEFPEERDADGNVTVERATAYTDGFDPAEKALAGERPVVPCPSCGAPQVLTASNFVCSACGAQNSIELKTSGESGDVADEVVAS